MSSETVPKPQGKINLHAFKGTEHGEIINIVHPQNLNQVLQIIGSPEPNGVQNYLKRRVFEAIKYGGGLSPFTRIHVWVESLTTRGKKITGRYEYRSVLPGREKEQVEDLLRKIPAMTEKVAKKKWAEIDTLRFGFFYGLTHAFAVPEFVTMGDDSPLAPEDVKASADALELLVAEVGAASSEKGPSQ